METCWISSSFFACIGLRVALKYVIVLGPVVLAVVITTIISPILLKIVFKNGVEPTV